MKKRLFTAIFFVLFFLLFQGCIEIYRDVHLNDDNTKKIEKEFAICRLISPAHCYRWRIIKEYDINGHLRTRSKEKLEQSGCLRRPSKRRKKTFGDTGNLVKIETMKRFLIKNIKCDSCKSVSVTEKGETKFDENGKIISDTLIITKVLW